MQTNKKAFTLVEMIVAMAVSTIIIAGAYASYDMVKTQYTKNLDLSQMQQSGRAIMQMIERDARMAGFEYLDEDANMTYGKISSPLTIKDSGNKCCDELTVIYDYVDDVLDWKGRLVSSSVNRIRVRYWTEAFTSKKGDRFRLYKQKDILGKSNVLLTKPIIGNKEVMADFIEDLQFINITTSGLLYGAGRGDDKIYIYDPTKPKGQEKVGTIDNNSYYIYALAFGPNGLLYGVGRGDDKIYIWDPTKPKDQEKVGTIDTNLYYQTALAFGPNGLLYAAGQGDDKIYIYDPTKPKGQEKVGTIDNNSYYIYALAFGPNGLLYGVGRGDDKIYIWDPTKPKDQEKVGTIDTNLYYQTALAFKTSRTGQESLLTINLTLRAKEKYGKIRQYLKKDYTEGNFAIDKTDNYKRDTFSSKVLVRNMML